VVIFWRTVGGEGVYVGGFVGGGVVRFGKKKKMSDFLNLNLRLRFEAELK
jgi:hypothetical protein